MKEAKRWVPDKGWVTERVLTSEDLLAIEHWHEQMRKRLLQAGEPCIRKRRN
jgi:hypothetical protein